MGTAALMVPEYVAATTAASAAVPTIASVATPAIASAMAPEATAGTLEGMGLLEMSPGNFINPEYFVGEGLGMPLFAGSPDAPLLERAGNVFSSGLGELQSGLMGGKSPMNLINTMRSFGQPQGQPRPVAQQGPRTRANMQTQQQTSPIYSQVPAGIQLTEEQKEMLRRRIYG